MTSWHHRAACVGLPLELFFGADEERGHARENREEHARRICASCRVRIDCLIDATRNNESGFWGGMTEKERKSKRRRDRCKAPQSIQETA